MIKYVVEICGLTPFDVQYYYFLAKGGKFSATDSNGDILSVLGEQSIINGCYNYIFLLATIPDGDTNDCSGCALGTLKYGKMYNCFMIF